MILLLGTANEGKIREIRALLSGIPALELLTRREITRLNDAASAATTTVATMICQ